MKFWIFLYFSLSVFSVEASVRKTLSFKEIIKLHKSDRHKYMSTMAEALMLLDPESKKVSILEQIGFYTKAHAESYRCIGGGIPVPSSYSNCGLNSYAGFTCPQEQEICNPFIFGVKSETAPLCFDNATTRKCFDNAVTGTTTFTDPVFNRGEETGIAYEAFRSQVEGICSGAHELNETTSVRNEACEMIERQTNRNRERGLKGFVDDTPEPSVQESVAIQTVIPQTNFSYGESNEFGSGDDYLSHEVYSATSEDYTMVASGDEEITVPASYFNDFNKYKEFVDKVNEILAANPELAQSRKALEHGVAFYYKNKDGGVNSCGGDTSGSDVFRNQEWINITDYTVPRTEHRMHYINMRTGEVVSDHAAHGSGSGSGPIPTNIDDTKNSNRTSGGFFETQNIYTSRRCPNPSVNKRSNGSCRVALVIRETFGGREDNAIRLRGLMESNQNALSRGVVHHGATYVNDDIAGRSSGCPAPQVSTFYEMRDRIAEGAMMYLHTIEQDKLSEPEC